MSSWLSRSGDLSRLSIATTAVASSLLTAALLLTFQQVRRLEKIEDLKSSIPDLGENHHAEEV